MPQEFQVLQCYQCSTFQVHQVKKSTKWNCKLCGEKQSIKKVFGRGSGADCRCHVQRLNTLRGEIMADTEMKGLNEVQQTYDIEQTDTPCDYTTASTTSSACPDQISSINTGKWDKYIHQPDDPDDSLSDEDTNQRFTTDKNQFNMFHKQSKKRKRETYMEYQSKKFSYQEKSTAPDINGNEDRYHRSRQNQVHSTNKAKNTSYENNRDMFHLDSKRNNFSEDNLNHVHLSAFKNVKQENKDIQGQKVSNTLSNSKWDKFTTKVQNESESEEDMENGVNVEDNFQKILPSEIVTYPRNITSGYQIPESIEESPRAALPNTQKLCHAFSLQKSDHTSLNIKNQYLRQMSSSADQLSGIKSKDLVTQTHESLFSIGDLNEDDLNFDL